ncbi:MAG: type IV secretory system conjugative DNA transfer family protein [Pseudomonadota bacterium]
MSYRNMGRLFLTVCSVLFCVLVLGHPADAQMFHQQNPYYSNTLHLRLLLIAVSGLLGFGLGWFCSPGAKRFRMIFVGFISLVLIMAVFIDNGPLGWSVAWFAAAVAFMVGLGYWLGWLFKNLLNSMSAPPTTFGSAKWADFEHLQHNNMLQTSGYQLGKYRVKTKDYMITYDRDRHLLTVAPNRSGKGTTTIIRNLLTYLGSILVIDPKGENARVTAEHRHAMGQHVYIVDPWSITGFEAAHFNPIDWLVRGDVDITENAMLLADALVVPTGAEDQFWVEEAKALLQGLILYVATEDNESGNRTLARVRDLLLLDGEDLKTLFNSMVQSAHHIVASTGARCLQKEERLLSNVIASAQAQTHFLDSARIRESLSYSDFKFEDLKTKPMSIYLVLPSDRLNAFGRWLRLLIQQALTVNARNIHIQPPKPVLFMLDEMAALGRLSMLEQAYGLMAGYGIQIWGIIQDLSQLKRIYGDGWETFISNAGVLQYFGSRDKMTAEYFSSLCGVTTVWNFTTAVARAFGTSWGHGNMSTSDSTTRTETTAAARRQLATPDELMRMHHSKQLLLIENLDPIQGFRTPWFNDPTLQHLGRNLHKPES